MNHKKTLHLFHIKLCSIALTLFLFSSSSAHAAHTEMACLHYGEKFTKILEEINADIRRGDNSTLEKKLTSTVIPVEDLLGCGGSGPVEHFIFSAAIKSENIEALKILTSLCKIAYKASECPLLTSVRRDVLVPGYWKKCNYPNNFFGSETCGYLDYRDNGSGWHESRLQYRAYSSPMIDYLGQALYTKNRTIISFLLDEGAIGGSEFLSDRNYWLLWKHDTLKWLIDSYCNDGICFGKNSTGQDTFQSIFKLIIDKNKLAITGMPLGQNARIKSDTLEDVIFKMKDPTVEFIQQLEGLGFSLKIDSVRTGEFVSGTFGEYNSIAGLALNSLNFDLFDYLVKREAPLETLNPPQNIFRTLGNLNCGNPTRQRDRLDDPALDAIFGHIPITDALKNSPISQLEFSGAISGHHMAFAKHLFKYGVRKVIDIVGNNREPRNEVLFAYKSTAVIDYNFCASSSNWITLLDFAFVSQRDRMKFNKICDEYYLSSLDFIEYILKNGYVPSSLELTKLHAALNAVSLETDPQFLGLYSKIKTHLNLE